MSKQHPYVVPPYSAIVSPLHDVLAEPLAQRLGIISSIARSAREELQGKQQELGSEARYVKWVWSLRPRGASASKAWKPFHHGETKAPLTAAKPRAINAPIPLHKLPHQ